MLTKVLGIVVPTLAVLLDSATDVLAPYIATHPKVALWIAAVTTVAGVLAKSPLAKIQPPLE